MNSKHDEHVKYMALKPDIIGLDSVVLATAESNIFKNGHIYRQPDNLMFDPSTKTLYNIEYKCHHTQSMYNHAKEQLKTCERNLQDVFTNWRIVNLYINDNYKIEKIR